MTRNLWILTIATALCLAGGGARAQLGLGLPPLGFPDTSAPPSADIPSAPGPRAPAIRRPSTAPRIDAPAEIVGGVEAITSEAASRVSAVSEGTGSYAAQAREALRRHGDVIEADEQGRPVVGGEITGLGVTPRGLAAARAAGFQLRSQERIPGLDLAAVVLVPPRGLSAAEAIGRLRALDPEGRYDFNHLYFESGGSGQGGETLVSATASGRGLRIGLVDGAALAAAPALARTRLVQRAFGPGGSRVTAHATAVASLLAGSGTGFRGAAPGATLYVADVYGRAPTGGSALAMVRALGWLAQARAPVVNVSLVGPPDALLSAGVAALVAKGHLVVAAVGNDGPGAGPLYPAAYPGVVAVTGVDPRRRVLPEAGRGPYVAFAAPGSDMLAAGLGGALTSVRGTSFAAPLAAGRLAQLLPAPDPDGARRAIATLAREAADLGAPGRDPVYGRGLVAFDLAVRPASFAGR